MLQAIKKLFVDENAKALKQAEPVIEKTRAFEEQMKAFSETELAAQTVKFKERIKAGSQ